ncbi:hypothetical protein PI95_025525 [Hassallia byssoidea VB512170]|uniref:Uncharacterized protein n=1 Tax=Hassallia byssoidea VB512170 TaxID=1304833 RepID=A0A846HEU4_9CYAN|nr:hypothetical protein [Hassalia byssoidea]NEU75826.1 hypothetical protein [Hassalia byssoidea VB512170]
MGNGEWGQGGQGGQGEPARCGETSAAGGFPSCRQGANPFAERLRRRREVSSVVATGVDKGKGIKSFFHYPLLIPNAQFPIV